jgi:hypothetical protein
MDFSLRCCREASTESNGEGETEHQHPSSRKVFVVLMISPAIAGRTSKINIQPRLQENTVLVCTRRYEDDSWQNCQTLCSYLQASINMTSE